MQNYNSPPPPPGYARPGSTASFAGQHPPPLPLRQQTPLGYQPTPPPPAHNQWASPIQTQGPGAPWNQPQQQQQQQQAAGGYNPGTYGAVSGGYAQGHQAPATPYAPPQQHDMPPPPPPKPPGISGVAHQQPQQPGGYPAHGAPQQQYNGPAPPPPPGMPGGYGGYSMPAPGAPHQPPPPVISPNEQHPVYIPPSLTGQGVQAYMPANTNPMPGVYVPPPPDVPAWQQALHAPLQGTTKKFTYTKPTVDPSFYAQGYQGTQPPQPYGQHTQFTAQPQQGQNQYGATTNEQFAQPNQPPPGPYDSSYQHQQQQQQQYYGQPLDQFQQQQSNQNPQGQQMQQPGQYPQQQSQWQPPAAADQGYNQQQQNTQTLYGAQQQQWHPGHQPQNSVTGQQFPQAPGQGIEASKLIDGRPGTTPPNFISEPSPLSQPVSPIGNRHSMSFTSGHHPGRMDSIGSVALANLHSQRVDGRTESPKPPPMNVPTPPPHRDDQPRFSALGDGGPSDWEHFGADHEIDDEELFGVKKDEKKVEPLNSHSVELPAEVPSPPSRDWPSPAQQPVPLNMGDRRDTYQPTPELFTVSPAHNQSFVQSPPPPSPPSQQQSQYQPPTASFVMNEEGWPAHSIPSEARDQSLGQHPQQPLHLATGLAVNDGGRDVSQPTPTQASSAWNTQDGDKLAAELRTKGEELDHLRVESEREKESLHVEIEKLKATMAVAATYAVDLRAKEEAFESLRIESENAKADLRAEIERLKVESEGIKANIESIKAENEKIKADTQIAETHITDEKNAFIEQIESMRVAAQLAQTNAEASTKEKDITIERLSEDVEGKEDTIKERDTTIADLRRQLEAEKAKESPRPTAADLIPDIDPWYVGSLERFIIMLRNEASEPQVEDKVKIFKAFMKAESGIRGIEYYDAPSPAPVVQPTQMHQPECSASSATSNPPSSKQVLSIHVPSAPPAEDDDDYDYSPGGRPILKRKPTLPPNECVQASSQSTTILTPTSSVDDDSNKTPVQSPPEEPLQPQYKAYVPPVGASHGSIIQPQRQSTAFSNVQVTPSPKGAGKSHDEIFFEAPGPQASKTLSRNQSSGSDTSDIPIPAPLSFGSRPASTAPPPQKDPLKNLTDLLPAQIATPAPSRLVEEIMTKSTNFKSSSEKINELTKAWEKSTSLARRKRDDARRQRREENEQHNDELFNSEELSYADMKQLEIEFEKKEAELKAQEDRAEYQSYVETVFDKVYSDLQADIKALTDIYIEAENLLQDSETGIKSLENSSLPSAADCLRLLVTLHAQIENNHALVAQAVADRDKRYKRTEIQPLNAARNFAKMKSLEQHFAAAEKQAIATAKREKAARLGILYKMVEDVVVEAVSVERAEIDRIVAALRTLKENNNTKITPTLLDHAQTTLSLLKNSSKTLLALVNDLEIQLNAAVFDADIAQAKAEGADIDRIKQLEREMAEEEEKLKAEFGRRVGVLEQNGDETAELVEEVRAMVEKSRE